MSISNSKLYQRKPHQTTGRCAWYFVQRRYVSCVSILCVYKYWYVHMTVDGHASTVGIRALICPLCMFVGKIDTRFKSLLWNGVHLKKHGLETIVTCYRHI